MGKHRSLNVGGTLAILAVLFVAVIVLVNSVVRGARVDLTENGLYTLSEGTKEIVSGIEEPINLYLFFSDRGAAEIPLLRTYATRVRELLEEIAARSGGKINLQVIDPLPFSEEEDRAAAYGLQALPIGQSGETIYFGLVGTNATDGQMLIPFLQPDKEAFLEYDIAKMLHGLSTTTKPVVGLISGLELTPGFDPNTRSMRPGWAIYTSLQELFDIRELPAAETRVIEDDIKTLVLLHPKNVSDDLAYAIDQFVLRGGNLIAFVDPNAELDTSGANPADPTAAMMAVKSSDLPKLFDAWGVEYDASQVLLDNANALGVQSPTGGTVRHLAILGFDQKALNPDDVITAPLSNLNFQSAGAFRLAEGATAKLVPLVQSSGESALVAVDQVKFAQDPNTLFAGFKPTGETYVVAARLQGKLKTAFADRSGDGHLAESTGESNIVLVADTDVASDRLWVQVQSLFGQQIMNAFANNGDFIVNAVDNLTGSSSLISVRGRATSSRPFERINALRRQAEDRYRSKEQELNRELADTETKLNELQRAKSEDQALILSPEQKAELDRFQQQKVQIRRDLRQVRRQLDAEIESLSAWLKFANILLLPLALTLAAAGFAYWRRRRAA